jgi:hypothetical protein
MLQTLGRCLTSLYGKLSLSENFCPNCNSDAPECDTCYVCHGSREYPLSDETKAKYARIYGEGLKAQIEKAVNRDICIFGSSKKELLENLKEITPLSDEDKAAGWQSEAPDVISPENMHIVWECDGIEEVWEWAEDCRKTTNTNRVGIVFDKNNELPPILIVWRE